ncbi:hypothetical protein N665_0581s0010 [Sinapis alba]|nr:hypothetical protein N665_0581s0010 [Sinapis alba]
MSRIQNLLCFTILVATVTFFNVASAHVKIIPALPQTEDPIVIGDMEPYTVKVVSTTFVADLEKECAKTEKFRDFFEKINAFSKDVYSVSKLEDHEFHMKAKAGSLFQAISALGSDENGSKGGKVNQLQKEKIEAMETVKMLQSIGEKITGGQNNKTEINGTLKLTTKQQKEIKDGILKWVNVITRIAKKADEISMESSSSKLESKEEENSVGPRILSATKSSREDNKNSDKKRDNKKNNKNSDKKSGNKKNKKGESKKKKQGGGTEKRHNSAKSRGGSDDDKNNQNNRKSNENGDKNQQTKKYGKVEKNKGGVHNKTAERLRLEAADELD